jgi:hypothetical protein
MAKRDDLAAVARDIIDSNLYMVLGTAGEDGRPWVTPVYFAPRGYAEFYWISSREAMHSRNLVTRPEVSIVVFDSQVPISTGQAVYMEGLAEELRENEVEPAIALYTNRATSHGGQAFTSADVQAPAAFRIYRVSASAHWVLDPDISPNQRTPVTP